MNRSKINTRRETVYAYTIQGWLKGVNSETLLEARDMGKDGVTTNINQNFGKDAFGYTLGYYEGDYAPIGTGNFEATKTGSDLMAARNNLYNGNISSMVTTITNPMTGEVMPNAFAYQYDQLNRIVEAKAYANIDMNGNTWQTGSTYADRYYNHYTYDDNGNILTALVKNDAGQTIDDQTYHYKTMYGHRVNNKLYAITDNAAVTGGFDLTDQTPYDNESAANNYGYTEIGELKWDVSDKIDDIKRRIDGKITEITRTPGSGKTNLKFDYDPLGKRIAKHSYTDAGYWIESEYYVRDAKGVIMSTYKYTVDTQNETTSFKQTERFIYGSSLLGIDRTQTELIAAITPTTIEHVVGNKNYSLQNHLQNDLVVISDLKIPHDDNSDGTIDYYTSDIVSAKDYGVFGEYLANRVFNPNDYPNSFNGKRDDQELNGWQDYGERNYLKYRRGFDRVDNLFKDFPWNSPYSFAENDVIRSIDLEGKERFIMINNLTTKKSTQIELPTAGKLGEGILYITQSQNGLSSVFQAPIGIDDAGNISGGEINRVPISFLDSKTQGNLIGNASPLSLGAKSAIMKNIATPNIQINKETVRFGANVLDYGGTGVQVVGYGVTLFGFPEVGIPLAEGGATISGIGSGIKATMDAAEGNFTGAAIELIGIGVKNAADVGLNSAKTLEKGTKDILKQNVNLKTNFGGKLIESQSNKSGQGSGSKKTTPKARFD